jgi:hypothetical protein
MLSCPEVPGASQASERLWRRQQREPSKQFTRRNVPLIAQGNEKLPLRAADVKLAPYSAHEYGNSFHQTHNHFPQLKPLWCVEFIVLR